MPNEAPAAATVDSATTQTVDTSTQTPQPSDTWTADQLTEWTKTGAIPRLPKSADSATASDKKDKTQPDSSTGKDKSAVSASDSATDTSKEPHLKTKEDTERRFKEILEENKSLQRRLESLERGNGKTSDTRDAKQVSQPAPEVKTPPLKQFLNEYFAKAENKGKAYEDGVEAWQVARDADMAKGLERKVRQDLANEAAARDLNTSVAEAKKRYPDFEQRIPSAVNAIVSDQQIPLAVKAIVNESPVFADLMYVLAEPAALADLIQTAKTNPAAAIRKIVLTEQLVIAELAKAKGADKAADQSDDKAGDKSTERDASGKFVSSDEKKGGTPEPKPRAPKPPAEVGGRGAASEAADVAAARSGNFRDFEAEQNRKARAAMS